jgi:hypothetical protein
MSVRVRAPDEWDGELMDYITIYLFKFKVIIGISNACGVFERAREGVCWPSAARTYFGAVIFRASRVWQSLLNGLSCQSFTEVD